MAIKKPNQKNPLNYDSSDQTSLPHLPHHTIKTSVPFMNIAPKPELELLGQNSNHLAGRGPLVNLDTNLIDSVALADANEITTGSFALVTNALLNGSDHVLHLPTLHVHGGRILVLRYTAGFVRTITSPAFGRMGWRLSRDFEGCRRCSCRRPFIGSGWTDWRVSVRNVDSHVPRISCII